MAVAIARPDKPRRGYSAPPPNRYEAPRSSSSDDFAAILRDDREYPSAAGAYSTDTETEDGIKTSASGYGSGPDGAVESQGSVAFTFPDGQEFELSYVADAEGYQPESRWLPVAPAFPHEIPQFVLDQIAKAAREDAEAARSGGSRSYEAPPPSGYSSPTRS